MSSRTNDAQIARQAMKLLRDGGETAYGHHFTPLEVVTYQDIEEALAEVEQIRWEAGLCCEPDDPQAVAVALCEEFGVDLAEIV